MKKIIFALLMLVVFGANGQDSLRVKPKVTWGLSLNYVKFLVDDPMISIDFEGIGYGAEIGLDFPILAKRNSKVSLSIKPNFQAFLGEQYFGINMGGYLNLIYGDRSYPYGLFKTQLLLGVGYMYYGVELSGSYGTPSYAIGLNTFDGGVVYLITGNLRVIDELYPKERKLANPISGHIIFTF